jgi:hypothetical protein
MARCQPDFLTGKTILHGPVKQVETDALVAQDAGIGSPALEIGIHEIAYDRFFELPLEFYGDVGNIQTTADFRSQSEGSPVAASGTGPDDMGGPYESIIIF